MNQPQNFQTRKVLLVAASHMLHDVFSSFLAPLTPLLRESANISLKQVGWLNVAQGFPTIFNPLIGLKTKQHQIMKIMVFGPAVTAIAMSLLGLASNFWTLLVLLSIAGISSAFFHVPSPVLIKYASGSKVGRGMSFYMVGGEVARFLSPLVILGAVDLWGLGGTYNLIPLGLLASAMLHWRFKRFNLPPQEKVGADVRAWAEFRRVFWVLFLIGGILLSVAFIRQAITAFLPAYLVESGRSIWFAGISLSLYQGAGALGTMVAGSLSDRLGRTKVLSISMILTSALMLALVHGGNVVTVPVIILIGLSAFATAPIFLALMQELGSEQAAFMNGLFMTVNFMTLSLSTLIVGWLGDIHGLIYTYKLLPFLCLPGIAFVLLLPTAIKRLNLK